jgi:hypothetical protein
MSEPQLSPTAREVVYTQRTIADFARQWDFTATLKRGCPTAAHDNAACALVLLILVGAVVLLMRLAITIVVVSLLVIGIPYVAVKRFNRQHEREVLLARVPEPLKVASVDYRLEESWGLGFMPGDNETGFVVYSLTEESSAWARSKGSRLGEMLPGGAAKWHPTPVGNAGDHRQWHNYDHDPSMMTARRAPQHPPTVWEYLEKYGFIIPIEPGKDAEADQAI